VSITFEADCGVSTVLVALCVTITARFPVPRECRASTLARFRPTLTVSPLAGGGVSRHPPWSRRRVQYEAGKAKPTGRTERCASVLRHFKSRRSNPLDTIGGI